MKWKNFKNQNIKNIRNFRSKNLPITLRENQFIVDITKPLYTEYSRIFGLNLITLKSFCIESGIYPDTPIYLINENIIYDIQRKISYTLLLTRDNFFQIQKSRFLHHQLIQTFRGYRQYNGFPSHGQRTSSNAKNSKWLKSYIEKIRREERIQNSFDFWK